MEKSEIKIGKKYCLKVIKININTYGEIKLILDTTGTSLCRNSSVKVENVKLVK